jgi:hypothetical protein
MIGDTRRVRSDEPISRAVRFPQRDVFYACGVLSKAAAAPAFLPCHAHRCRQHVNSSTPANLDCHIVYATVASFRPPRVLSRGIAWAGRDAVSRALPCKQLPGGYGNPPSATTSGREELA